MVDGCVRVAMIVVVLCVLALLVVWGLNVLQDRWSEQVEGRAYARAAEYRAEAALELAREQAFEQRFMVWTTGLMAFTGGITVKDLVLVIGIGLAAYLGGWGVGRMMVERQETEGDSDDATRTGTESR